MTFYFFEPFSQKNNGLFYNQSYHPEKKHSTNPFWKDNYSYYSYPYINEGNYSYPYYQRNNKAIHKSFVRDLMEALQDEDIKNNTTKLDNMERKSQDFSSSISTDIPVTEISHEPSNDTYYQSDDFPSSSIPNRNESEQKETTNTMSMKNSYSTMKKQNKENDIYNNEHLEENIDHFFIPKHEVATSFYPRIDITESEKQYHIYVDLPGMTKEEIHMEIIQNNILKLSGERKLNNMGKNDSQKPKKRYLVVEQEYGKFERSLMIPENVNSETIQAKMENGVLDITINKKEIPKKQTRVISIQ